MVRSEGSSPPGTTKQLKGDSMTTILRGGEAFEVIDECGDMYAVCVVFRYADFPYLRELKLWWNKKYCTVV